MHARGDDGQYLAISLSAADEYANMPVAELREKFVPALAELFPAAKDATVTEFFVTREKRATFRQVPGTAQAAPEGRDRACPAWCWRARGPTPAGPTRWRARSAAA